MLDIFCAVCIFGRPTETKITLLSLDNSDISSRLDMNLYCAIPPRFCGSLPEEASDFMSRWDKGPINMKKEVEKSLDYLEVLGHTSFESIRIIPDRLYPGTPYVFQKAFLDFLNTPEHVKWFVWVENDVLFNPDWFEKFLGLYKDASEYFDVGITFPLRTTLSGSKRNLYGDEVIEEDFDFIKRKFGPSACWIIPREVMFAIKDEFYFYPYIFQSWDHDIGNIITNLGYTNIVAKKSFVQHIGINGAVLNHKSWVNQGCGGLGFEPDLSIISLYREAMEGIS